MGLTRREPILFKIEASYGVDAAPVPAADGVLVENPEFTLENIVVSDRNGVRSTLATIQKVVGDFLYGMKFAVELKGSGVAGTPPEIGKLLRCCAMGETIVPVTSVTYEPSSDVANQESATIYGYQDGQLVKLLGCRGTVEATIEANKVALLNFTFVGHRDGTITDTGLVSPTVSQVVPPAAKDAALTLGGTSLVVPSVKWNLNNNLSIRGDISAADGFADIVIVGRDTVLSIDPEVVPVATKNHIALMLANTAAAFTTGAFGSAGNEIEISAPEVAYRGMSRVDREGIRADEFEFGAAETVTGDDDIAIAFT